jgi:hypothetical protein
MEEVNLGKGFKPIPKQSDDEEQRFPRGGRC